MFFKFIGYLVVGALMVLLGRLLYEKIIYIKKPIKTVYGEITYNNPAKIIVYDFSKFEKDGIVLVSRKEIEIVDKKLLEKTNGVVQGMSGSPIIQNEYIIGAITHVVVEDPHRGYGILIENMLEEAEN